MHPVIKAQCQQFKANESLYHMSETEVFEAYTIYSIISGKLGYGVNPLDVHLKGDEFGLDGVAVIIQGELVKDTDEANAVLEGINNPEIEFAFFQSKTSTNYDYGDIVKLFDAIDQFFDDDLYGESDQLNDIIDVKDVIYRKGITKKNPGIRIYYATSGIYKKPARIEKLISDRIQKLRDRSIFDNNRIDVEMLGADKLQTFYRSASRSNQARIDFPKQVSLPKNLKVEQGYIGFIDASELVKMVEIRDDAGQVIGINRYVFFDNVRDYNENSSLNKRISNTIEEAQGTDFVFRNNGVTVIAKAIHRTADDFRIEDYQIVNGCQTANILFNNKDNLQGVSVPFRLIGTTDDDFIASIIIGTNSQNQIKEEQFLALLPFVKNLEEYCRSIDDQFKIFIERRENQYHREEIERARIMQLPVLLKAISATLLGQPNRSARDYKKIYSENKSVIFQENSDVRIYHAIAYLYYRLEFLWRNQKIDSSLKIFRFYIIWAVYVTITNGVDVLKLHKSNQLASIAKSIVDTVSDEETFKEIVRDVSKKLTTDESQLSNENREKLRDTIRSDAFFQSVRQKLFGDKAS
ncbi:AIPR family protein [Novacetimonas pomaceti]|uniref:AIPR family protein n=1 Tax=Novacetimonas pomaceti TaxID=2021998 RepID=UPI001C2D7456|nr:AIPR family protein [Novacetimonas pomaceti]MBV1833973.1 AIPR family protein [Novacetimonas pomaceti]